MGQGWMDKLEFIYGDTARRRYEAWLGDRDPLMDHREDPGEAFKAGFMAGVEVVMHNELHTGSTPGCAYCAGRVVRACRDYVGVPLPPADEPARDPDPVNGVLYSTEGGQVISAYRPYHARGCPARPGEADAAMCLCGGLISPVFNNHT